MSYEEVPTSSRRKKRNIILVVVGVIVLIVLVVVLASVLSARSNGSFKKVVIERCRSYIKQHSDTTSGNDCEKIWEVFEQAYVGKNSCDVSPEAYGDLMSTVQQNIPCNTKLFWSKTKDMVHAFTSKRECLKTMEDTLLGFLFNDLIWCSKNGSKETFIEDCPGWNDCVNNPRRSFWYQASTHFAASACGNVSVMLNGSLQEPFSSDSIFGSVEAKELDPKMVNSLTVLLVAKDTDSTTCDNPSFQNLKNTLNSNIVFNCRKVPSSRLEGCISDTEIPCQDCF